METLFTKAVPKTLRSEVVEILREAIINGKLQPGEHLKENLIAQQMGVSRSPVREALRLLEQEGLIESFPNQGCFVKTFQPKEIEEIFTLRATLENLAFELIIHNRAMEEEDWQALEDLIEQQHQAIQEKAFEKLTNLDMDFHEYLCKKADSERLLDMWRSLRWQIQMLFYQRFRALESVPETVDQHHHAIIDALRKGDLETLTRLNKEINLKVARECVTVFRDFKVWEQ